jgi:pteridine reductase
MPVVTIESSWNMIENQKIVLITGAARRIGAEISRIMHNAGYGVILHYNQSVQEAKTLADEFNRLRNKSAWTIRADFQSSGEQENLIQKSIELTGRLDVLVNNASSFYPTTTTTVTSLQWDEIIACNLKTPYFLCLAAQESLRKTQGCIVNIVDIYARSALPDFSVYSISKSGLAGLTHSLAKEFSPDIRVNGISPGVILWPENEEDLQQEEVLNQIPLQRQGTPVDIAKTVLFLVENASYITGQIISVDGGKSLL